MRNLNSLKNPKFNFTGNFWKMLILPLVVIVTAIALFFTIGFKHSTELQGGTIVTIVAEDDLDLYKSEDYNSLKKDIDEILKSNNLTAESYQVVNISAVGMGLTIKLDTRALSEEEKADLNTNLLSDIKTELYSTTSLDSATIEDYVKVETYYGVKISNIVLSSILASLIAIILVAAYLMLRVNISSGVTAIIFALFNNILATAIVVVCRIPVTINTFIYIPVVTILTAIFSLILYSRVDDVLDESEDNRKLHPKKLANLVVAKSVYAITSIVILVALLVLVIGSFNVPAIRFTSIALCTSMIVAAYSMVFLSPLIWSKGYIRRHKKAKVKTAEDDKPEVNIMKDIMNEDIVRN